MRRLNLLSHYDIFDIVKKINKQVKIMNENEKSSFVKGLIAGVAVIVILGGVFMLGRGYNGETGTKTGDAVVQPTNPQPTAPQPPEGDPTKVAPITDNDHIRGDKNAKVTIVEYSDFECPFCARFVPTIEQALADYPNDVRLVYRHFPLRQIHPVAQKAAEASECAAEQGKFWELHDAMFELNVAHGLTLDAIKSAAADLGLNTSTFNDCVDSGKTASVVEEDYQNGRAAGVTGTPGSFINGQYLAGALPYAQVKQLIEASL